MDLPTCFLHLMLIGTVYKIDYLSPLDFSLMTTTFIGFVVLTKSKPYAANAVFNWFKSAGIQSIFISMFSVMPVSSSMGSESKLYLMILKQSLNGQFLRVNPA